MCETDIIKIYREQALIIADEHYEKGSAQHRRLIRSVKKRCWQDVVKVLYRAAEIIIPEQNLHFAILAKCIEDLAISDDECNRPRTGGDAQHNKQTAINSFIERYFEEDAHICGIDPEYVISLLIKTRLLKRRPVTV